LTNGLAIGRVGESDVSLVKSVFEENRDFIPNESEFKGRKEEQILRNGVASATPTILFTVPANNTLFITSCHLRGHNVDTDLQSCRIDIDGATNRGILIALSVGLGHDNGQVSFNMPVKVVSGQSVTLHNSPAVNTIAGGGFIGWLERKEVLTSRPVVAPPQ